MTENGSILKSKGREQTSSKMGTPMLVSTKRAYLRVLAHILGPTAALTKGNLRQE